MGANLNIMLMTSSLIKIHEYINDMRELEIYGSERVEIFLLHLHISDNSREIMKS